YVLLEPQSNDYCAIEDQTRLEQYLQGKREELKDLGSSYTSQMEVQKSLNSFFESYSNCP
ncbi:MAG: hypothetical protein NXH75_16950, partial [Halobacteriovoraceae bacterium]|nr:hypothetical protein [Halobacteriovoraceae bacterium]